MIRSRTLNRRLALLASALMVAPSGAYANPQGGQVVGGQATINGQGTKTVTVNQGSNSAIIDWRTFSIGAGEFTIFNQPSASSVALNRVIGNLGPSQIFGTLQANGRIFIVNPYGILFGNGSVVNVAGFLATTNDIKNKDFMAGRYNFNIPGRADASIVNLGTITAASGGFAALVAPGVRNAGVITANLGQVGLASGNGFTLDFYGDKLITLQVGDSIAHQVIDVATGKPLNALVSNEGTLSANGGQVALTAVAARTVVDSVINNTGTIEANSVGTKNGMIVLGAATDGDNGRTQTVNVSGTLSAAGKDPGTKGGTVQITGQKIALNNAKVDVSGQAGGGSVNIGGKGFNPSTTVTIDSASTIDASAKSNGNGGSVVVWANASTSVAGSILATGGAQGGNGGTVETSGQTVNFDGASVNTSAPNGSTGMWLIDPTSLVVGANEAATIGKNLANTNITLKTTQGPSGDGDRDDWGGGDIIVNSSIGWSSANTLTLDAFHNIDLRAPITASTGGLTLNAGHDISIEQAVKIGTFTLNAGDAITATGSVNVAGTFTLQGGFWDQVGQPGNSRDFDSAQHSLPAFSAGDFRIQGGTFLRALGGDGSSKSPYQITDVYGLQGIGSPSGYLLGQNFVLANNIDASGTANWNDKAGFVPIGQAYAGFGGTLDGKGFAISGLTIAPTKSGVNDIGLFGVNFGTISNVVLTGVSVKANQNTSGSQYVGTLVGRNFGMISDVTVTGSIHTEATSDVTAGGLVGQNNGQFVWQYGEHDKGGWAWVPASINDASAGVSVTVGASSVAGGLVGDNAGHIGHSSASGNVTAGTNSVAGGLVGQNGFAFVFGHLGSDNLGSQDFALANTDHVSLPVASIYDSHATGTVTVGTNGAAGGLVGDNAGHIGHSWANGTVTSDGTKVTLGGLVGLNEGAGKIWKSHASGDVTATNEDGSHNVVGGLVGWNDGTIRKSSEGAWKSDQQPTVSVGAHGAVGGLVGVNDGTISRTHASATVSGGDGSFVGGLVGVNDGTVRRSHATGGVSGGSGSDIGGLVGDNAGWIGRSWANGNVTSDGTNVTLGGLVGWNESDGHIWKSHASGNVSAPAASDGDGSQNVVGGLVGWNDGTIRKSSAGAWKSDQTMTVSVGAQGTAGGLVGFNDGTISRTHASATVSGGDGSLVGGLVGDNAGSIGRSSASGKVTSDGTNVTLGGLVGLNESNGTIWKSLASGAVTGGDNSKVGGLVGENDGTIRKSHASGAVTAGNFSTAGGLVALNVGGQQDCDGCKPTGIVSHSSATGSVTVGSDSLAGGLVGDNAGHIGRSWASGAVTSDGTNVTLGGLVGLNEIGSTIWKSHASGDVTATNEDGSQNVVGGLVGWNAGTIRKSSEGAWKSDQQPTVSVGGHGTAGGLVGVNDVTGTISKTSASATVNGGDFSKVGGLVGENDGTIRKSHASGAVTAGNSSFAGGLVAVNVGGQQDCDDCQPTGVISRSSATGDVTVGSNSTAGGLVGFNSGTVSHTRAGTETSTVTGGDGSRVGGLVGQNDGTVDRSHALGTVTGGSNSEIGGLVGDNLSMIGNSWASVTVTSAGTNLTNVRIGGLVGFNEAGATIGTSHATGNVTANSTGDANCGNGCVPIMGGGLVGDNAGAIDSSWASGNVASNGVGVTLGGLVGLNEFNPDKSLNGTITNSHAGGNVDASGASHNASDCSSSNSCVQNLAGGLVGWNQGAISNSFVSGPDGQSPTVHVGSQGIAGGLVGQNDGSISQSQSNATVTGDAGVASNQAFNQVTFLGGLVGLNFGSIDGSSATGAVGSTGVNFLEVAGLVAKNRGTISNSQASGNVAAGNFSAGGGLVGENNPGQNCGNNCGPATITNSSATGNVTVGSHGVAAGLVAINNGTVGSSQAGSATSTVTAGDNSIVGGLVAFNSFTGVITNSSVLGAVASTGPNSAVGGFVGVNGGSIDNSQAAAGVTATSDSFVGGFVGMNIGSVVDSHVVAPASVAVSGSGNLVGGFVGMNLGSIDPSTTSVTPSAPSDNIVGGFAGANFNFANANFNGLTLPAPTFPTGTISNSTTTDTQDPFIGTDRVTSGPSTPLPPIPPSILNQCSDPLCILIVALPLQQLQQAPTTISPIDTPPPFQLFVPPPPPNNQPVLADLTLGSTGGTGGTGGNGGNGNNRSPGPPPGPGLGRTYDEQHFSGVPPIGETRFKADEIVVQIVDTVTLEQVQGLLRQFGLTLLASEHLPNGRVLYRLGFTSGTDIRRLIAALEHKNLVASVQPDYVFHLGQTMPSPKLQEQAPPPSDVTGGLPPASEGAPDLANSGTASLESLPAGDSAQYVIDKLHLAAVHRLASGRNVTVAIVDSEIDVNHPDLKGVIADRYDATESPSHPHVHGTGMAGAIAARSRLLGVAPGVRIVAIKAFDEQASSAEATSYQILKGLDYAIDKNVRVINMSFAGPRDPMMERTLKTAHDKGIILIAAAGNAGPKSPPLYPGADPSVIAVTATDYTDKPFAMANRGKYIAVAAPGVDVMVPAPGNTYQLTTGTSVAAAHVSGVAALLVERKPTITPDEVRADLMRTAHAMNVRGKDDLDGAGLVDPAAALALLLPPKTNDQPPRPNPNAASVR